ncbi:MAG: VCBS repeat-containing protein [Verrucomicrobiota bacterium]
MIGTRRGGIALRINDGSEKEAKFSATPRYVEANGAPIDLEGHVSSDFVDINADGLPDLVCVEHGGTISWYPNEGTASEPKFSNSISIANDLETGPVSYPRVSVADLNGDSKPDILVGGKAKETVGFWVFYQK